MLSRTLVLVSNHTSMKLSRSSAGLHLLLLLSLSLTGMFAARVGDEHNCVHCHALPAAVDQRRHLRLPRLVLAREGNQIYTHLRHIVDDYFICGNWDKKLYRVSRQLPINYTVICGPFHTDTISSCSLIKSLTLSTITLVTVLTTFFPISLANPMFVNIESTAEFSLFFRCFLSWFALDFPKSREISPISFSADVFATLANAEASVGFYIFVIWSGKWNMPSWSVTLMAEDLKAVNVGANTITSQICVVASKKPSKLPISFKCRNRKLSCEQCLYVKNEKNWELCFYENVVPHLNFHTTIIHTTTYKALKLVVVSKFVWTSSFGIVNIHIAQSSRVRVERGETGRRLICLISAVGCGLTLNVLVVYKSISYPCITTLIQDPITVLWFQSQIGIMVHVIM